jgi:hypothetical protein
MQQQPLAIIGCGGRDYQDSELVESVMRILDPTVVIHGAARGADTLIAGTYCAVCNSSKAYEDEAFPADWDRLGKSAGHIRNRQMLDRLLEYDRAGWSVAVLAFPGRRGTTGMIELAHAADIRVIEPARLAISASQISSGKCLRKWAFSKLVGLKSEETDAQAFGKEGHFYQERWLDTGVPPDQLTKAGRLAYEGMPLLPQPGQAFTEIDFWGRKKKDDEAPNPRTICGVPFHGYIDVFSIDSDGIPRVTDHKFVAKPDYALDVERLRRDPQGILYPLIGCFLTGAPRCRSRWAYYPKNGSRPFPVDDCLNREQLAEAFVEHVLPIAKRLFALRLLTPTPTSISVAQRLPCNPYSCKFSGVFCDFSGACDMNPKEN